MIESALRCALKAPMWLYLYHVRSTSTEYIYGERLRSPSSRHASRPFITRQSASFLLCSGPIEALLCKRRGKGRTHE